MVEKEEALICEALVREINNATRWSAVIEAWLALLRVRRMASEMKKEENNGRRGATEKSLNEGTSKKGHDRGAPIGGEPSPLIKKLETFDKRWTGL